jgi:anti-sigma factor RsiW
MAENPIALPDELLIAYVRGHLPEPEAARIATLAAAQPSIAAELALARGLVADLDTEAAASGPGELGWARLERALDAKADSRPTRRPLWQLTAAAAAAVLVWQVVAVPLLPDSEGVYAPVSETPAARPGLTVAFAPEATEAAMRALLREVGAEVIGGPTAVGLWQLGFADASSRDAALARVAGDPIVESAQAD